MCIHSEHWCRNKMCNGSFSLGSLGAAAMEVWKGRGLACVIYAEPCELWPRVQPQPLSLRTTCSGVGMDWMKWTLLSHHGIHPHNDHQFACSRGGWMSGRLPAIMVSDIPLVVIQGVLGLNIPYQIQKYQTSHVGLETDWNISSGFFRERRWKKP